MKYSKSLDLVLTSLREAQAGKMVNAAALYEKALAAKDLPATIDALEAAQVAAFEEVKKGNPTIASLFEALAAKKKKKVKAKGKPFGGKQAPPFKKKAKAGLDDDLGPVLDDMTTADDVLDGDDLGEPDDLSLDDLEGLDDFDGVDEMPEATAGDEGDDDKEDDDEEESAADGDDDKKENKEEESSEDSDDDEEAAGDDADKDDEKEEESQTQTAKVKLVTANLAALERLRETIKSKQTAGAASAKPAKK